jgi:WD40 repeat protein
MLLPSPKGIPVSGGWSGSSNSMAVGWSPDGTTIAASDGGYVHLWHWKEKRGGWEYVRTIPNPSWMNALTWSPDSQRFATADNINTIRIWHASTGQQLGSYSVNPPHVSCPSDMHTPCYDAEIRALAWAPDGKHLLSGDAAGRVLLWAMRC